MPILYRTDHTGKAVSEAYMDAVFQTTGVVTSAKERAKISSFASSHDF